MAVNSASEYNALKARIAAEIARRAYYGNISSLTPTASDAVVGEPMRAAQANAILEPASKISSAIQVVNAGGKIATNTFE